MSQAKPAPAELERHGLSDEQLVAIFRTMVTQRTLENRGFQLNRQGKIPFASASEGHEAVQAGAAMAFERGKDILVPYYRDLGLALGIGVTPYEVLLSLFARAADHSAGRQFPHHYASRALGVHSISSVIAAQLPHAVGAAYAIQYRREAGRAVLTTFGDGATSEGEWHESLNFAAVHRLPIVFLCENNEWAISTPLAKQMAQPDVHRRAEGYGMPGTAVDGMDADRLLRRAARRADPALGAAGVRRSSKPSATVSSPTRPTTTTAPTVRATRSRSAASATPFPASNACWSSGAF